MIPPPDPAPDPQAIAREIAEDAVTHDSTCMYGDGYPYECGAAEATVRVSAAISAALAAAEARTAKAEKRAEVMGREIQRLNHHIASAKVGATQRATLRAEKWAVLTTRIETLEQQLAAAEARGAAQQAEQPRYHNVWIVTEFTGGGIRGVFTSQADAEAEIVAIRQEHPDLGRSDFVIAVQRVRGVPSPDVTRGRAADV